MFIFSLFFLIYLQGLKRKGTREPDFLAKINGVFICLVTTVIRHCLKEWAMGECAVKVTNFKYETAGGRLAKKSLFQKKTNSIRHI